MKIGHFLNYAMEGGTVDMIVSLMRRSKHDMVYVTYRASTHRKEEFKNHGLELVELGEDYDSAVKFMKENVDVVHAANSGGPEPGVSIGFDANKPVVETCQSPSLPSGHLQGAYVVAVSHGIQYYWPDDLKPFRVIYSCAEPVEEMSSREAKTHFGLDPDKMVVGRIGRLEGLKRPQDFISAAVSIIHEAGVQFFLVGSGSDGEGIAGMAKQFAKQTGGRIFMPGFLRGEEKIMAYNAIDIFLYPTTMEGFGIVFAEAMSLGIPIITYSDPVNIDVVGAGGLFVPDNVFMDVPRPFQSLAAVTMELLHNDRERDKLGTRGKQVYTNRYRPEIMAVRYDKLYEEIV